MGAVSTVAAVGSVWGSESRQVQWQLGQWGHMGSVAAWAVSGAVGAHGFSGGADQYYHVEMVNCYCQLDGV